MLKATFEQAYPLALRAVAQWAALNRLLPTDREDAEQQAALAVWRGLRHFNPARGGLRTFVECVARNELVATRRCNWHPQHEPLEGLESILTAPETLPDLRMDVYRLLNSLDPLDQAIGSHLLEDSATETSRCLGVSRAGTYRAIGRLRLAFTSAGLGPSSRRHRARGTSG